MKRDINIEKLRENIQDMLDIETTATLSEIEEFKTNNKYAQGLFGELSDSDKLKAMIAEYAHIESEKEQAVELLRKEILAISAQANRAKRRRRLQLQISSIAAAVIFVTMLIYYGDNYLNNNEEGVQVSQIAENNDIATNAPKLITDSGVEIDLSQIGDENVINISKIESINQSTKEIIAESKKNRIIIPAKQSYKLLLNDGTVVYLNANSELSYPSLFSSEQREVTLQGEGFFSVTKSDKPFIVNVNDNKIKVYGTRFNVRESKNSRIETVLVEGSVGVTIKDNEEIMLKPNNLLSYNKGKGEYQVEEVNCNNYIGWMSDMFIYEDTKLSKVIEDLERWYDISFVYQSPEVEDLLIDIMTTKPDSPLEIIDVIERVLELSIVQIEDKYIIIKK